MGRGGDYPLPWSTLQCQQSAKAECEPIKITRKNWEVPVPNENTERKVKQTNKISQNKGPK